MAFRLLLALIFSTAIMTSHCFNIEEATINDIQSAFTKGSLTSQQLVKHYLNKIQSHNPLLHAVIEVNPDALKQAKRADWERKTGHSPCKGLHGIPVLIKDNIATKDRLNTTAGSLALLGSVVPRDAGVVRKLRQAGAVILGKASMSEWANFRSLNASNGWSARGGQGKNPYVLSADPCGSSSGSAIAVAANMAAVTLGTETSGSIICPASANSVVGIKPTVGITSRSGVIPISPRQDTVGPIARTVTDAVVVLEAIAGFDARDADATRAALKYTPKGGYIQFLNLSGMKGKRVGILRKGFFEFSQGSVQNETFEQHFDLMRKQGAVLIDNLEIPNISIITDFMTVALSAEFKISLHTYLSELLYSPVKSLLDVINFNNNHAVEEKMSEIGQFIFLVSQNTSGIGPLEQSAIDKMKQLSIDGIEKVMHEYRLDAIVTPNADASDILAIGGYPAISIPAGYDEHGVPFGISFSGLKGYEPKLIEIAFSFEQSNNIRKPPSFRNLQAQALVEATNINGDLTSTVDDMGILKTDDQVKIKPTQLSDVTQAYENKCARAHVHCLLYMS